MRKAIVVVFLLIGIVSCIDIFNKKYTYDTNLVSIEGVLTDQDPFVVTIVQTQSTQQTQFQRPIPRATVELQVGDGSRLALRESVTFPGVYEAPAAFRGKVNQSYRLRVRLADNRIYESTLERLTAAPPIAKVSQEFNLKGITDAKGIWVASSVDVSIDLLDNAQEVNFYQWRTFLYEQQRVCGSCSNGEWDARANDCNYYRLDPPPVTPYVNDYECDRRCWQIYQDERFNIFSDALTNGKALSKRLVKSVPFYQENAGALLEIQQMSISPVIYRYYNLIKQQSETTGTLTDVPPSPPIGNWRNVNNAEEAVLGYFSAAGIVKNRIWIDRSIYSPSRKTTMLPGGRARVFDSGDPYTRLPKPYFVVCGSVRGQTPVTPEGWRF